MVRFLFPVALAFLATTIALPSPANPPSGAQNIGNGQGRQFITGACLSDADCQSQCCATTAAGDGVCSAEAASTEQGKQGCGFTGGRGSTPVESTPVATESPVASGGGGGGGDGNDAGSENVGTGNGQQFITGQCLSDADCASGCCAGTEGSETAACSARAVANESGKTGCGFTGA